MRGVFDSGEPEPDQSRRETELTLSSMTLLGIFFGLVLICGLCFGLGYAMGGRVAQQPVVMQSADGAQTVLQGNGSLPKPSPIAPIAAAPQQNAVDEPTGQAPSTAPGVNPIANSPTVSSTAQGGVPAGENQVRPALQAASNASQVAQPATVQPALGAPAPLMVQIAEISQQADADVLVSALRKRGYAVSAQRNATDGLIHVCIGPFSSLSIANRWRQKLLNDGYNAIVLP